MRCFKTCLYLFVVLFSLNACSDMSGVNDKDEANKNNNLFSFYSTKGNKAEKYTKSQKSKTVVSGVRIAGLSNNAISIFKEKKNFTFNVSPTKKFQINTTKLTENRNGSTSLVGDVIGGHGSAILVLTQKGITGSLRANDQFYRVSPAADGLAAISKIDPTKFPDERLIKTSSLDSLSKTDSSNLQSKSSPSDSFTAQSSYAPNGGPTHGVLVLYTQAAKNNAGDISGLIQTAIDETNQSYGNSNLTQNVYLAHSEQTSYSEFGKEYVDYVEDFSDTNDGNMDNVVNLRSQYNADIAVLLVVDSDGCGAIRADATNAFKDEAYAVVTYDCATSPRYSFGHEIGHLLGALHDRADDDSNDPYQYGHGYVDPNKNWRTIMAYDDACGGSYCPRVPYWSNPDVNYPPTGQAMGTYTYEDNARAISNRKYTFANFYTLPSPDNVHVTNWDSPGQHPMITWDLVSGQNVTHKVQRCVSSTGDCVGMDDFYALFQTSSATSYQDQAYDVKLPCFNQDDHAYYRVTAQNYTGLSYGEPPEDVCVE